MTREPVARRRLFWKILLAFLLTYIAITQAIWLLLTLTQSRDEVPDFILREETGPVIVAAAAQALEAGGKAQYETLRAQLPKARSRYLHLIAIPARSKGATSAAPPVPSGISAIDRIAIAPSGTRYAVRFAFPDTRPIRILNVPPIVLGLGLGAGLIFASLLAWYLTSPISHLRRGFEQLARGNLTIRLSPLIGRRRDEVADLAGDFDRMARQVEQLVSARDRLLHDVSHELRSPLARIQLATALADRSPQRTAQALARVETEVGRLDALVGELLTLARAENEGTAGDDYFDLAGVTDSVVADVRFEAAPAQVSIALENADLTHLQHPQRPASLPLVRGNAELLRRAIENILRNALRFSPPGATIHVRVAWHDADQGLEVAIEDEGPGIPEDQVDAMFEPFVRASSEGSHFGLGLAIASRAVRLHRGTIEARNRPSGGLCITLRIPTQPLVSGDET